MDIELRNDRIPRNPFDRQFLDMHGRFAPSTGFPRFRDDGFNPCEGVSIVKQLKATGRLVAMDLNEVNPELPFDEREEGLRDTLDVSQQLLEAWYQ